MSYFGKYKDSRKAVDLNILDDGLSYQWSFSTWHYNIIYNERIVVTRIQKWGTPTASVETDPVDKERVDSETNARAGSGGIWEGGQCRKIIVIVIKTNVQGTEEQGVSKAETNDHKQP